MYLVANIDVEICAAKSCKLCTQYCPEANTIQYSEDMGKDRGFKYGSAYVAVDRCKGCAQCVWVCDNMAKNNAIKMIMIDQLPLAAVTDNITYEEKTTVAVLSDPMIVVGN
jgi:pyruvate ferredoxin oxidoreductase delta subunit